MIDFYGMTSPNAVKIYIALEEMGLDYKETIVDVFGGENHAEWFRKLNPNGKVPVIVDHDGPGGKPITLFESGAILLYLAKKTGKLIPADEAGYYQVMQWVFHQHGGLGPMGGQLAHFVRFAPECTDPYPVQRYLTENHRLYDLYESELGKRPYLAGDEFSVADVAVWPWILYRGLHGLSFEGRPNFEAWFDKIAERPAVKRIMDHTGKPKTTKTVMTAMTEEEQDRFFGRGRYARVR